MKQVAQAGYILTNGAGEYAQSVELPDGIYWTEVRNPDYWVHPDRPIKIRLTDEQNTNLMTAYPELGMWRKIQGLPVEKVMFEHNGEMVSGADTYLSEWYDITMGEDVFTVEMIQGILNSFGAIIINR